MFSKSFFTKTTFDLLMVTVSSLSPSSSLSLYSPPPSSSPSYPSSSPSAISCSLFKKSSPSSSLFKFSSKSSISSIKSASSSPSSLNSSFKKFVFVIFLYFNYVYIFMFIILILNYFFYVYSNLFLQPLPLLLFCLYQIVHLQIVLKYDVQLLPLFFRLHLLLFPLGVIFELIAHTHTAHKQDNTSIFRRYRKFSLIRDERIVVSPPFQRL